MYGMIKDWLLVVSVFGEIDFARAFAITCAREFGELLFCMYVR